MIWYACYGSNMDLDRFLKYIQGGKLNVNGKVKTYEACQIDTGKPRAEEPYIIQRRFYFAKKSKTWSIEQESGVLIKHGVGFISTKSNKRSKTYGKLYLISKDQFTHLFALENGKENAKNVSINYEFLQTNKTLEFESGFYNQIVLLAENYKGYPILTFTNKEINPPNLPMKEYLELISKGLQKTHNLTEDEIVEYFKKCKVSSSKTKLRNLLNFEKK
jgi:hypothetical protein